MSRPGRRHANGKVILKTPAAGSAEVRTPYRGAGGDAAKPEDGRLCVRLKVQERLPAQLDSLCARRSIWLAYWGSPRRGTSRVARVIEKLPRHLGEVSFVADPVSVGDGHAKAATLVLDGNPGPVPQGRRSSGRARP